MNQNKDIRVTVRLTPEQYESIRNRAASAMMTPSAYIRAAAMRHKVTVIPGLKEISHERKGIGRNLNQLTLLANAGAVTTVYLTETFKQLAHIYNKLTINSRSSGNRRAGSVATVNFIPYKSQSKAALSGVLRYVEQEKKTLTDTGQQFISGQKCTPQLALQEFIATREMHRKKSPVWFYHYTQSFSPEERIAGKEAHELAKAFAAQAWPESEVLISTHIDAAHIHTHFIVNAVCPTSGKMLRQGPNTLRELRQLSDRLCQAHGFYTLKPYEKSGAKLSSREYRAAQKIESWKFQLMAAINASMKQAGSREEFILAMRRRGYEMTWTPERKAITFTCPNGMKCRDNRLHQEKYRKGNLELEFAMRKQITEELSAGGLDRCEHGESGADGGHPLSAHRLRDSQGAERGGIQANTAGGEVPAGAVPEDGAPCHEGRTDKILPHTSGDREAVHRTSGQPAGGGQPENHGGDADPNRTGWEDAREIYLRCFQSPGLRETGAWQRDPGTAAEDHRPDGRGLPGLPAPVRLGLGALAAAAELTEEDEDPEDRQRRIEARRDAELIGTLAGAAAGLAAAGWERHRLRQKEAKESEMTLGGM